MLFGKGRDKGLIYEEAAARFRVVSVGPGQPPESLALHDETNLARATALAALCAPGEPMALGVLYRRPADATSTGMSSIAPTAPMTREALAGLLSAAQG